MDAVEAVENELETLTVILDAVIGFIVAYGFQILGAIVVLLIGLKISGWAAKRLVALGERRGFDPTLTRFAGNIVRVVLIAIVVIITLNNFGITISPLVALVGASAFGVTLALQGPLSNYGAGVAIILTRPFVVGNTIQIQSAAGVVEEITLGATVLNGEDGEKITIPNKEVVGQIIVNSHAHRVVETKVFVRSDQDVEKAIAAVQGAISGFEQEEGAPGPQVGIHDFAYGGTVVGARFWVPSLKYFQMRYNINRAIFASLADADIKMLPAGNAAVLPAPLTADEPAS